MFNSHSIDFLKLQRYIIIQCVTYSRKSRNSATVHIYDITGMKCHDMSCKRYYYSHHLLSWKEAIKLNSYWVFSQWQFPTIY